MQHEDERKPKPGWRRWSPPLSKNKRAGWASRWPWTGFGGKTLWDWQTILIVPIAAVVIASVFTAWQAVRQQAIENERAEAETLQAYLDQMGTLVIDQNLRTNLTGAEATQEQLAQAQSLEGATMPDGSKHD